MVALKQSSAPKASIIMIAETVSSDQLSRARRQCTMQVKVRSSEHHAHLQAPTCASRLRAGGTVLQVPSWPSYALDMLRNDSALQTGLVSNSKAYRIQPWHELLVADWQRLLHAPATPWRATAMLYMPCHTGPQPQGAFPTAASDRASTTSLKVIDACFDGIAS
jgi:hypothetical protein